jgi:hypothetical protein
VFGTVADPNNAGNLIDANILTVNTQTSASTPQTVKVCPQPTGASVNMGSDTLYVICADNSMWTIDLTHLGLGQPLQPKNINAAGNPLKLSSPTEISIIVVQCEPAGYEHQNCQYVVVFSSSFGAAVSMIDLTTNTNFYRDCLPQIPPLWRQHIVSQNPV